MLSNLNLKDKKMVEKSLEELVGFKATAMKKKQGKIVKTMKKNMKNSLGLNKSTLTPNASGKMLINS